MRAIATLLFALFTQGATAQHWVTPDACAVDTTASWTDRFSAPDVARLRKDAEEIENGTGRYWRIASPEGKVSHLFGTVHSNAPALLRLPDRVQADIAKARVVAIEVDFIAKSRRAYDARRQEDYLYRHPRANLKLEDYGFPGDINAWTKSRLHVVWLSRDAGDILTPGGLASALLGAPCNDFANGVYPILDDRISMLGALHGATILGLEDESDLLKDLSSPRYEGVAEAMVLLYASFLNPSLFKPDAPSMIPAYLSGELAIWTVWERAYLSDLHGKEVALNLLDRSDSYLLAERNHRFLAKAQDALQIGELFMAVGAAHLLGQEGLVTLLRNQGYNVTRVLLPGEVE